MAGQRRRRFASNDALFQYVLNGTTGTAVPFTALQAYIVAQNHIDLDLDAVLADAAAEAQRRVAALAGRDGVSAAVSRAQYAQIVAELRRVGAGLWQGAFPVIESGLRLAGDAASAHESARNRSLFGEVRDARFASVEAAERARAADTVRKYIASTSTSVPLSRQVYKTRELAQGYVEREIGRSILLGESWSQLAKRVRGMIRPDVKGGVSYAAKRLARTEMNNAFHAAQIDQRSDSPFAEGFKWVLSGSHPKRDVCNDYAERTSRGRGPGEYAVGSVPTKPHPQCLCYLATVLMDEADFLRGMARGQFEGYLNSPRGRGR